MPNWPKDFSALKNVVSDSSIVKSISLSTSARSITISVVCQSLLKIAYESIFLGLLLFNTFENSIQFIFLDNTVWPYSGRQPHYAKRICNNKAPFWIRFIVNSIKLTKDIMVFQKFLYIFKYLHLFLGLIKIECCPEPLRFDLDASFAIEKSCYILKRHMVNVHEMGVAVNASA